MKKADNQKLKMLYLAKILFEQTDERHGITMPRIINALNGYGIQADRKTLYTDIAELKNFGLNIEMRKEGKFFIYHLVSRDFDLSELKLLADCVQSSKYVSEKKSRDLIRKLESLASSHEAPQLKRQVLLTGRVKSMNESIFGSIDDIQNAISLDRQISFKYVNWTLDIKENLRRDEKLYCAYSDFLKHIKYHSHSLLRFRDQSVGPSKRSKIPDRTVHTVKQY